MLSPEQLRALNGLPPKEALRRPLDASLTKQKRLASLLAGAAEQTSVVTIGDAMFRWARVETEALAEADVTELQRVSDLVGAVGRLPKRLSLYSEAARSAASLAFQDALSVLPFSQQAAMYLQQRAIGYVYDAQGCEASIFGCDDDVGLIMINGLLGAVHSPALGPPTLIDRLTFYTGAAAGLTNEILANPLLCCFSGLEPALVSEISDAAFYAAAAVQAGRMVLLRDKDALTSFASLASSGLAGHLGAFAGKAAAVTVFGLTGSWVVVLAPAAAGFAGHVVAKNWARRARYHVLCRKEVESLARALSDHCLAARDVIEKNIAKACENADRFRAMHFNASGAAKDCIEDWLDRLDKLQKFRGLHVDRFHRAGTNPTLMDPHEGDLIAAAQEALLASGRVGIHPANVSSSAAAVVHAVAALHRKLTVAVVRA
jgi:hypothetical protein